MLLTISQYPMIISLSRGIFSFPGTIINIAYDTFIIAFNLRRLRQKPLTIFARFTIKLIKHIQALNNLGCATEHWDDWLVFLVAQKLDKLSREVWELKFGYRLFALSRTWSTSHICAFDANATEKSQMIKRKILIPYIPRLLFRFCPLYKMNHLLYQCSTFLKQTSSQFWIH